MTLAVRQSSFYKAYFIFLVESNSSVWPKALDGDRETQADSFLKLLPWIGLDSLMRPSTLQAKVYPAGGCTFVQSASENLPVCRAV